MAEPAEPAQRKIWDIPLRVWHWAFAACVGFSLYTGLDGDISWLEWHVRSGLAICGLLAFRIGWAIWGGRYARLGWFRTSPGAVLGYFRGDESSTLPRTPPGAALALLLVAMVFVQATTGLFATDEIFTEGPLARSVEIETARDFTYVHNRLFWGILGAIGIHLMAHLVYAVLGGPHHPRSMVTGHKPLELEATDSFYGRALLTALLGAAVVYGIDVI